MVEPGVEGMDASQAVNGIADELEVVDTHCPCVWITSSQQQVSLLSRRKSQIWPIVGRHQISYCPIYNRIWNSPNKRCPNLPLQVCASIAANKQYSVFICGLRPTSSLLILPYQNHPRVVVRAFETLLPKASGYRTARQNQNQSVSPLHCE